MNANYIYDIFDTTRKNEAPDLLIGLAMLQVDQPIPEGLTEKEIGHFIGRHYQALVDAYATRDRAVFEQAVKACEELDAREAEENKAE